MMAWWRALRLRKPDDAAAKAAKADGADDTEAAREHEPEPSTPSGGNGKHPIAAASLLTGAYVVFATWMFVAWYNHHKPLKNYRWGGDGWLGPETYAGGADKFGHAWATMGLARLGTVLLNGMGGMNRRKASIISTLLSEMLFTGVEGRDGTYYEFSFSDLTGDTVGAVLALLLDNFPKLDEMFDFRVEYFPSKMYLRKLDGDSPCRRDNCSQWNIAEDYSGQNYLAALHLAALPGIKTSPHNTWSRFVDVAVGFRAHDYRPIPDADLAFLPKQDLTLGLAFNAQGFFDWLLEDSKSPRVEKLRKVTHGVFEVASLPFTSLPFVHFTRDRDKPLRLPK